MAETKHKGDLAEAIIIAECIKRGYKVALPLGEDWRFDLIVLRHGNLERVQCKYTESDGNVIVVMCRSANNWGTIKYTSDDIDWIAVYDKTTDQCYFISSDFLGKIGRSMIKLRLTKPKNNQIKKVIWARDFTDW